MWRRLCTEIIQDWIKTFINRYNLKSCCKHLHCVTSITCICVKWLFTEVDFYLHYSYMQISTANINWFIFIFYKVLLWSPQNQELEQEVDPPPIAHLYSDTCWNLSHRKWSCAASCEGQTNYSPFEKCTFFLLSYIFLLPSSTVFFSPFIVVISGPPERNSQGDKKLCYLRYLKMSCIQTQNELLLWLHRLQNSRKYSPAVFPEDLWYSCPQYPHNAFVEFPKWMKSRFI